MTAANAEFVRRLRAREPLLGAFLKTPHPILVEVLGLAGLDYAIVDCEHAPFGRHEVDAMMLAGRAAGLALLVRVPGAEAILGALDAGAAGVLVPHVRSAAEAEGLARAMRYGPGGRGYAGTTRAAGYGTRPMGEHLDRTADETALICQIEDPEAVPEAHAIAGVDGVDGLFVGRADLAVGAGGRSFFDEEAAERTRHVLGARGCATGLYAAPGEDLGPLFAAGATMMTVGSEHTMLMRGAALDREAFDAELAARAAG
jgi:2-keto-3-deoxy-L-rhamnonate aldolase RhmA